MAISQLFSRHVLARAGWCCGFGGGFVISDVASNRWGGLTFAGAPVLFLGNGIVVFMLLVLLRVVWYGVHAAFRTAYRDVAPRKLIAVQRSAEPGAPKVWQSLCLIALRDRFAFRVVLLASSRLLLGTACDFEATP